MKIKEIIELSQEKRIDVIAKEHLDIGEKPTRAALKLAGAVPQKGKRGWVFEGPSENLEKSIYDFAQVKASKPKANVRTKEEKKKTTNEQNDKMNTSTNEGKKKRKRASFDIEDKLLKSVKIQAVIEDRPIYEVVEDALRNYLNTRY